MFFRPPSPDLSSFREGAARREVAAAKGAGCACVCAPFVCWATKDQMFLTAGPGTG